MKRLWFVGDRPNDWPLTGELPGHGTELVFKQRRLQPLRDLLSPHIQLVEQPLQVLVDARAGRGPAIIGAAVEVDRRVQWLAQVGCVIG